MAHSTLLNTQNMIPFNAQNDLKNLLRVPAFLFKKRVEEKGAREKVDLGKLCLLARSPPGCVFYTDSESVLSHVSDNAFIIKFHICI